MTVGKTHILSDKYNRLVRQLYDLGKVVIAYSGGVDSTFLLAVSTFVLKENAVGITIGSPALPRDELEDAINNARLVGEELTLEIYSKLQEFGFQFVSVDILGYRIGSFNEIFKDKT